MVKLAHKTIFMVMVFMVLAAPMAARADEMTFKNVKTLKYINDPSSEIYPPIFEGMSDVYKNTLYDKTRKYFDRPLIYIAKADLDNDGLNEYIARPSQEYHEEGMFCVINTSKCPFYIFDLEGDVAKPLGVITANSVDVGEQIVDGYKTLKAFTMEDDGMIFPEKFDFYETYKFDVEKKTYVNAMVMPGEKIKTKKAQ